MLATHYKSNIIHGIAEKINNLWTSELKYFKLNDNGKQRQIGRGATEIQIIFFSYCFDITLI